MSELYFHIGMPKTGTTAIQNFMFANRKMLKEKGCVYALFPQNFTGVPKQRNGHFLYPGLKDPEIKKRGLKFIYSLAKKYSKIVLSDEDYWNKKSVNQLYWYNLKNDLNAHGIQLKIIVYLRRQDAFFSSLYAQHIKGKKSATYTFKTFLNTHADTVIRLNYFEQLTLIAEAVGKEKVIVRPYEFQQFKDNSIIADFLSAIDVEIDNALISNSIINPSIEGNILEVKRYLNMVPQFRPSALKFNSCLAAVQNELREKNKFRNNSAFINDERKIFMSKYELGNKRIAKNFLGREDGVLFENPLPENDPKSRDYTIRELKEIFLMIEKENSVNKNSPFTPEEYKIISQKAMNIMLKERAGKGYKIKKSIRKYASKIKHKIIR